MEIYNCWHYIFNNHGRHQKSTPVEFIIETDGTNITLSEEKRGSTEVITRGKGYVEDHEV